MTEGESGSGTGVSAVVNAVLIVITIAGFLTLVRQELTSDRPPPPANSPRSAIGIQTLDARLWEDPLRPSPSDTRLGLAELRSDVERRSLHDPVRLLPVMVSGGPYSEDQENRIRSRFAIVSALGQRGYAPLDAEHVGSVVVPWPKTADLEKWAANATTVDLDRGPGSVAQTACATDHGGGASSRCADLTIRFEWYRPRVFDPARRKDYVLVLWLDERFFEDDPLLRLPLLLGRFVAATRPDEFAKDERYVRLIGPQASQTLRAMLPKYDGDSDAFRRSPAIAASIAQILGRIEVFSPSASAMDEVLIGNIDASQPPRTAVREGLRRTGFKDSRFFNATDAQLADEIFAELQLRGVSLAKPHTTDHVVLLSEWDTFYGRMLSLTYGAVLAVRSGRAGNRAEFVKQYLSDGKLPENLHPYAYLRGLDGRTVCQAGSADCAQPKPTDQKQNRPDSFQQIVQWKPEANKAEGPGQFDYLSRTGALLEDLQRELQLSHRGEIKAIGIVGSDVYDVLLILQALRPRFPNALFFTTELDARLWNPKDREWARNLIVAGSYGLTLHRDLQQRIAPFRDSSQTALFAATLAALDTKGIDIFNDMSPRRFEIGNTTAVDLSVTPSGTPPLQPLTNSEESSAHREDDGHGSERLALLVLGLVGLLALYFIWNPLRRRTSRDCGFLSGDLAFFQSDVGGPDGAEKIVHTLLVRDDPVCRCLCTHLNRRLAESADEVETTDEMRLRSLRCNTLLELLNDIVHHVVRVETALDHAKPDRRLIERAASWLWRRRAAWWTGPLRLAQRFQARAFLDGVLDDITRDESNTGDVTLAVAHDARYAARKLFWWRLALLVWLGVVAVVALILGRALRTTMWDDTFLRPDGEPFSLAAGTSAWPNIGLVP